jgi:hypothetical protein
MNFKNNTYENVLTSSDITTISSLINTNTTSITTLTDSLANYASKAEANTFAGLQTFNLGLTVPANQTLTCNGTLAGGTITATTQVIGNNSTNVATTAYVDRLFSVSVLTSPATGNHTLPAQTFMKVYFQQISTSTFIKITDPTDAYIGQTITIHNKAIINTFIGLETNGSSLQGQSGNTFQTNVTVTTSSNHSIPKDVVRTFMFLGSTANPRWVVLGC